MVYYTAYTNKGIIVTVHSVSVMVLVLWQYICDSILCTVALLQVLQSDGGNYCASINAATLALIDAGIPMKDIVCACSASFMKETAVVDINHLEETHAGTEVDHPLLLYIIQVIPTRSYSSLFLSTVTMSKCSMIIN